MESLSPMTCPSCYDMLEELYRLHQKLLKIQRLIQEQTQLARNTIVTKIQEPSPSTESTRQLFYSKLESSGMAVEEVTSVINFVGNLHDQIVLKASVNNDEVKFPSGAQPHSPSPLEDIIVKSEKDDEEEELAEQDLFQELNDLVHSSDSDDDDDDNVSSPDPFLESDDDEKYTSDEDYDPEPSYSQSSKRKRKAPKKQKRRQTVRPLVVKGNTTSQYCDLCGELCPSSSIQNHLETQHGVQDFIVKCPNTSCPYVFSCRGKLDKHLRFGKRERNKCLKRAGLPVKTPFKRCQLCGFKTKIIRELRTHLEEHEAELSEEKILPCPLSHCSKEYALRQSVEEHLFTHDEQDQNPSRKNAKFEIVPNQKCDFSGKWLLFTKMEEHFKKVHNLQDYITKCLNPTCPKVFSCRGRMEHHLGKETTCRAAAAQGLTGKCETCGLAVRRNQLVNHVENHEYRMAEKKLSCPISGCPERYSLKQSMEYHLLTHDIRLRSSHLVLEQQCSICEQAVKIEDMEGHLKEDHQIQQVIPCKRCPFRFHDWETLLDHLEAHLARKVRRAGDGAGISCDLCDDDDDANKGVKFLRCDQLRQHFLEVHQIGSQSICEDCGKEFYGRKRLSLHKQKVHSPNKQEQAPKTETATTTSKKSYKCEICPDVAFSSDGGLYSHNFKMHGAPPLNCPLCSELFTSMIALRQHKRTVHLGLAVKEFRCSFEGCGKTFKHKVQWKNHELGGHKGDSDPKQFICETCGKGFHVQRALKAHVGTVHLKKNKHSNSRPICEVCGESFSGSTGLKRHRLIHTGERPFECHICQQRFRHNEVLKTHLKAHEEKGDSFKPNGPMKNVRKRVEKK